jgi:hypothetical protein
MSAEYRARRFDVVLWFDSVTGRAEDGGDGGGEAGKRGSGEAGKRGKA